jgi:DNA-binding FadR family transcriptional regulator
MKDPIPPREGTTLPRTTICQRIATRQLGVSRNSVIAAYEALAVDGLVAAREGSGTRVRTARPPRLNPGQLLRDAHYPSEAVRFRDPDGNPICLHR